MSKAKMEAARELINEKKYAEARAILVTVDSDMARRWIAEIDKRLPRTVPPKKPKRSLKGVVLLLLVFIFILGAISFIGTFNQVGVNLSTSLTAEIVSVSATSTTPIPAKISDDQHSALAGRCYREMFDNSGELTDFNNYVYDDVKAQDFHGLGVTDRIYVGDLCNQTQTFQLEWDRYSSYNDLIKRQPIDKGIAWTKFLEGWESMAETYIGETATAIAFQASKPTETTATPGH